MNDPQHDLRIWMQASIAGRGHGAKGALAKELGVRPDAITRMMNTDPLKETREIKAHELDIMRQFFAQTAGGPTEGDSSAFVSSFDPDAPDEDAFDERTDETPPHTSGGDVANLNVRGGAGIGSPEGVETSESGQLYADHINGFWSFPPAVKAGWRNMPSVYSMPVEGDSMEPTLSSGSYVFVDMTHTAPKPEDIYACDFGEGLSIKRLQLVPKTDKIMVMSDNARYADYELRREDVRVYGRVVAWFQWRG